MSRPTEYSSDDEVGFLGKSSANNPSMQKHRDPGAAASLSHPLDGTQDIDDFSTEFYCTPRHSRTSINSSNRASFSFATDATAPLVSPRKMQSPSDSSTVGSTAQRRNTDASSPYATPNAGATHTITMEFGDEYVGEAAPVKTGSGPLQFVPHGRGTLQSSSGRHCYVGCFDQRQREGVGKLVTERYVLWCQWRGNRPNLSTSCRIDFANGDKYCGYVTGTQEPALISAMKNQSAKMSKFSMWVNTTILRRDRWGEIVYNDGTRYFGQWEGNSQTGFGCSISPNGEKYIGMWFKSKFHGRGSLFRPTADGPCIYEGEWVQGQFKAVDLKTDEGCYIIPKSATITGIWKSSTRVEDGFITFPSRMEKEKRWQIAGQWETLLCGCSDAAKKRDLSAAAPFRSVVESARSRADLEALLLRFVKETPSVSNSIKIFRRCFYFLYGTCGNPSEIGAGIGGNVLGWCFVKKTIGGCIHRGHGVPIRKSHIDDALSDVFSFVHSLCNWIYELLGEKARQLITSYDGDTLIGRHLLDQVLCDVHPPLFNMYVQGYKWEQLLVSAAMKRLADVSLDDLGINFGRQASEEALFTPYADATHSIAELDRAFSLSQKLQCLKKWSGEIDTSTRLNQIKLRDEELSRLHRFVKERSNTRDFASMETGGEHSQAYDSPRSPPVSSPPRSPKPPLPTVSPNIISRAFEVQGGSADDLLPIHQYVLVQSKLAHAFAHTQLLIDLSADDLSIDPTSQEAFCVTTLHACVKILVELYPDVRDATNVITPISVFEKRVEDALNSIAMSENCAAPYKNVSLLMRWIPHLFDYLSTSASLRRDSLRVLPVHSSTILCDVLQQATSSSSPKTKEMTATCGSTIEERLPDSEAPATTASPPPPASEEESCGGPIGASVTTKPPASEHSAANSESGGDEIVTQRILENCFLVEDAHIKMEMLRVKRMISSTVDDVCATEEERENMTAGRYVEHLRHAVRTLGSLDIELFLIAKDPVTSSLPKGNYVPVLSPSGWAFSELVGSIDPKDDTHKCVALAKIMGSPSVALAVHLRKHMSIRVLDQVTKFIVKMY